MTVLMIPEDPGFWPTLGPQVCAFIEQNLIFGPGDLRGMPAKIDDEKRALIYRMYEVFPKDHEQAGRRRFKRVGISLPKGLAKALALNTPLPTPTGWTTMERVAIGEMLLGRNGQPCRVVGKSSIFHERPCYRVVFNDGTSIIADAEHRWFTQYRRPGDGGEGIFTTEQIKDTLYWHKSKPYANHRIPISDPLDLVDIDVPIPPYTLGVWLGDGSNANSMITKGPEDLYEIEQSITAEGVETNRYTYPDRAPNLWLKGLNPILRETRLLHNKHIPQEYLRASRAQRLALLQGLMDSDGTASTGLMGTGRCSFSSKDKALAEGMLELARTLGLRPTWRSARARFKGKDYGEYYLVGFTPRDDVPPFRLRRKALAAQRTAHKTSQALSRTIVAVEKVPSVPTQCLSVDSIDHLYLAGEGMVPTHNTELAAWIAACELHPEAPVRCTGWTKKGEPIGGPVTDPFIPLVAYTEEQSDELAYGTLKVVLEEGPLKADFDIGMERIMRRRGDGKAVSLATAPNARDGARTTFQVCDEVHWWTLARLKQAHQTMLANIPKRKAADAWTLEVTTAPEPGAGSVAEATMQYAQAVQQGRIKDSRLFFFHRQASDEHDLETETGARAAVIEASGPNGLWRDIEGIVELWRDPTTDRTYWERVWCNRLVRSAAKAFDVLRWDELAKPDYVIADGALVTLGFDGAIFNDSTGLIATEVETGHQQVVGVWEKPYGTAGDNWHVPESDVDSAVSAAFERWKVWRLYADPPYWQSWVATWSGRFGAEQIIEWWTNRRVPMTRALEAYQTAMKSGTVSHDGNEAMRRHVANAFKHDLPQRDENGRPLFLIRKERSDSPNKIDLAMAGCLSWEARMDALAAGANTQEEAWTFGSV